MEEINQNNEVGKFEEVPKYQEVETKKKIVRTDSYFDGGVLELIGWRILAALITTVTLGIASPWATCMLYSWQIKHTVYNGKRLKFEGTGGDLFVNMFKWLFFTIITLGIYALFVPVKKAKWVISNIHFEDEEFKRDESYFDGNTLQLIGINILSYIITFCSFGLLYPFATCLKLGWINKHTVINRKKLVFDGNGLQLWGKYILWTLLTIVTFGIFSLWLPILMLKWESKHIHIRVVGETEKKDKSLFIVIPIVLVVISLMIVLFTNVIVPNLKELDLDKIENVFEDSIVGKKTRSKEDKVLLVENKQSKTTNDVRASVETKTQTESSQTAAKTSITVGGYTLKFGTYKGQIIQGVWDEKTMTSKEERTDVILKLTESSITINGESGSYSTSGSKIIWKGQDSILEVTGNNRIRYNAENCPELIYQGN